MATLMLGGWVAYGSELAKITDTRLISTMPFSYPTGPNLICRKSRGVTVYVRLLLRGIGSFVAGPTGTSGGTATCRWHQVESRHDQSRYCP
jgi:hypothetical protein